MDPSHEKVVVVSGGFDPVHIGHVRMLKEARALGDRLVVILNNDNWLRTKKGHVFMPEEERAEVLRAFKPVDDVVISCHGVDDLDRSVSRDLERIKPDIFANGGDRKNEADIPEATVCKKYGIEMVFNIGYGGKVQSSSWLTKDIATVRQVDKPWGSMETYKTRDQWWVKSITVLPGARLSLQAHQERSEHWVCVEGEVTAELHRAGLNDGVERITLAPGDSVEFGVGVVHRLSSETGGTIIEVVHGKPSEEDIVRYEDDYGRI